jgi:hypothetical protein
MSTIFGLAQLSASDYQFMRKADQALIYNAVNTYLQITNQYRAAAYSLFVEGQTTKLTERIQLGMTGQMQRVRASGAKPDAARRSGSWDVAYPLDSFEDAVNSSDIDFAYMTPQEFQAHIDGVINRANETYRFEILRRIFKNTDDTFVDPRLGSVTIKPLANGTSGELYWPVAGTNADATANYYAESGYAASAISDTNNPIATITDALTLRWGRMTGEIPLAVLINSAQVAKIKALSNFVPYVPTAITAGSNTDIVSLPSQLAMSGMQVIGWCDSAWICVWDWIPANYMVGIHLSAEKPLKERVDPAETGLGSGLQLVARETDFPIMYNIWRLRFGIGTSNRLNGFVMELGSGGSYSIPSAYA